MDAAVASGGRDIGPHRARNYRVVGDQVRVRVVEASFAVLEHRERRIHDHDHIGRESLDEEQWVELSDGGCRREHSCQGDGQHHAFHLPRAW